MVYNEPRFLPIWTKYYSSQFGAKHCYVIDHGSDDGSAADLGSINIIRIPRSPMHDRKRADFLSQLCSSLLIWYDAVIYCDVDEFLVPDPLVYSNLADFVERVPLKTITTIGLNVTHLPDSEASIDYGLPVLKQRNWVRFVFAMCKPLVTKIPIKWVPGFHFSDQPMAFDRLFLFHLHHFDLKSSLARLAKTRAMQWGDGPADHYQRWSDEKHEEMVRAIAACPKVEYSTFLPDDPIIGPRVAAASKYVSDNPNVAQHFYFNIGIPCNELLKIPDRFRAAF